MRENVRAIKGHLTGYDVWLTELQKKKIRED